jgi:hypothetical protein
MGKIDYLVLKNLNVQSSEQDSTVYEIDFAKRAYYLVPYQNELTSEIDFWYASKLKNIYFHTCDLLNHVIRVKPDFSFFLFSLIHLHKIASRYENIVGLPYEDIEENLGAEFCYYAVKTCGCNFVFSRVEEFKIIGGFLLTGFCYHDLFYTDVGVTSLFTDLKLTRSFCATSLYSYTKPFVLNKTPPLYLTVEEKKYFLLNRRLPDYFNTESSSDRFYLKEETCDKMLNGVSNYFIDMGYITDEEVSIFVDYRPPLNYHVQYKNYPLFLDREISESSFLKTRRVFQKSEKIAKTLSIIQLYRGFPLYFSSCSTKFHECDDYYYPLNPNTRHKAFSVLLEKV